MPFKLEPIRVERYGTQVALSIVRTEMSDNIADYNLNIIPNHASWFIIISTTNT